MKLMECAGLDKQDLRLLSGAELSDLGVQLINRTDLILKCQRCGETWAPQLDAAGKLPFDYWLCPAKCNRTLAVR